MSDVLSIRTHSESTPSTMSTDTSNTAITTEDTSNDEHTTDTEASPEAESTGGTTMTVTIRPTEQGDFFAWYGLYASYAEFYETTLTDDRAMRLWAWLHSDDFTTKGLVAVDDESGEVVGIAHMRPFERPLSGGIGLYLDDLYVRDDQRRNGVGKALLEAVKAHAAEHKYNVVRWITAEDNATARALYDSVAEKTPWVTYDMKLD